MHIYDQEQQPGNGGESGNVALVLPPGLQPGECQNS
jgi:hypothetical protein